MWRRLAARAVAEADSGPVHINLPFREPLVPRPGRVPWAHGGGGQTVTGGRILPPPAQLATLASALQRARRPLVVAGEMRDGERLGPALTRLGLPVLAEPGSQLRRTENSGAVEAYEALLRAGWSLEHGPDLVIRVGATPTSRAMNSWLAAASPPTFLIDPDHSWRDQDQVARHIVACDPQALLEALPPMNRTEWRDEWLAAGKKAGAAISATLISTPLHEGHVVRALASRLPDASQVFIGSSMPIRAADSFWPPGKRQQRLYRNHGAGRIVGPVSTGLGVATGPSEGPPVPFLGELSPDHAMTGPCTIRRHAVNEHIVF